MEEIMSVDALVPAPQGPGTEILDTSFENIIYLAEKAEKMIDAMNKIMNAAIKITSEHDWVLIGGKPYLKETGASKVARLFGISWKIDNPTIICDSEGYKTYIFKGTFSMRGQFIEAEGSRSMKDEFFAGKDKTKCVDEISERNVRQSAYTNCINNGIKRIIPNLRNISLTVLEDAGLDSSKIKCYTFKRKEESNSVVKCEKCGANVSQNVASFSQSKFGGHIYCMDCQKKAGSAQ